MLNFKKGTYRLLREFEDAGLSIDSPVFVDTETYQDKGETKGGLYGKIRLVQLYQAGWNEALIYDCMFIDLYDVLDMLKDHFLVFHNGSYDLHTINLYTRSTWLPSRIGDTMYLSKLHFFKSDKYDFYSCLKYADVEDDFIRAIDKKANQKADWGGPLTETLLDYAAYDVIYLSFLYDKCKEAEDTEAYKLDIFNLEYAVEYARRGIPVNQDSIRTQLLRVNDELEQVLSTLPVNPNSPKQCCEYLGTSSSDKETLMKLAVRGNSKAKDIRDARQLSKERMFLIKYDRPVIKGFYNPCATAFGRFSCTGGDRYDHENLQQMPKRILHCLEAPRGMVFVYKDYAALELRMAVAYTGEEAMEALMRAGIDMHSYTAHKVFGVPIDQVSDLQRTVAKALNFGLIYGAGTVVIQMTILAWAGILMDFREVAGFIKNWFGAYPGFTTWHNIHKSHLQVYGFLDITTTLGRKVRTKKLSDSLNAPIQGSSSEVTKFSLKLLKERYPNENLISTIHDSNTLLADEDKAPRWVERLNECMVESWYYCIKDLAIPDLPMPPEAEISKKWDF